MADSLPKSTEKWSASQLEFIAWLSTPKKLRHPKTQQALAKQMGVHQDTLSNWKKWPGFREEVAAFCRLMLKDSLNDIYGALIQKATDGDVQAIKLAMEMTREYIPRQELSGANGAPIMTETTVRLDGLTDDEIDRILRQATTRSTGGKT